MAVEPTTPTADNDTVSTQTWPSEFIHSGASHPAIDVLMSQVLDRTTDGVLVSDAHGAIIYTNEPLLRMFGYEAASLIGQRVEILVPEYLRGHHRHHVSQFMRSAVSRPMGRDDLDMA